MKILYLSPDFVLPAKSGFRVRVLSQLRLLSAIEAVEQITFLSLNEDEVPTENLRALEQQFPKVCFEAPVVRSAHVRQNMRTFLQFLRRRFLKNEPYLIAVNDCPAMHSLIENQLGGQDYDVIYIGFLGMMAYRARLRSWRPMQQ